jgi:hypothetical protein
MGFLECIRPLKCGAGNENRLQKHFLAQVSEDSGDAEAQRTAEVKKIRG